MDAFLSALSQMATGTYWLSLLIAIVVGTVVGFIPGVGATLVTAIMLPSVLFLVDEPAIGIVLLALVGSLNNTLDSIPAVLVGLPGSETQVTYLEGHQLARKGKAAHTLGAIYAVSAIGGVIGAASLALAIPIIKPLILQFSYTEIAMLALFGIAMVALLSRGSMAKGLAAGCLGLLFGTVGVDPMTGTNRFTFGQMQLWEGLPVVTVILGFFALPELIDLTMTRLSVAGKETRVSTREVMRGARYGVSRWRMVIRQSLFGTAMGAIPGIGGSVIDWLSYAFGISLTKDKSKHNFGRGDLDGVLFAESAANSKAGGQALPTLTLGIPGSTSWAIIAVAMLSYGLAPGPSILTQHQDIAMLVVMTLAVGNLFVAGVGLAATNSLARITRIPYPTVGFMIMGLVFLSAYLDIGQWMVYPILMAFAGLGLLMKRYGWPRPPLILAFILGPIVEQNLMSAINIYGLVGVLTRPVAIILFGLLIVSVFTLFRVTSAKPEGLEIDPEALREEEGPPSDSGGQTGPGPGPAAGGGADSGEDDAQALAPTGSGAVDVDESAEQPDRPASKPNLSSRVLQEQNLAPLAFGVVAVAFVIASLQFPAQSRAIPMVAGLSVVALCAYQITKHVWRGGKQSTEIMDLGMRSTGMAGSVRSGLLIAGLFTLFFLAAGTIGLQLSAVGFATIGPALFLAGRIRWISAVLSGAVVLVFSEFLADRFIGVIWPDPFILSWLQALGT